MVMNSIQPYYSNTIIEAAPAEEAFPTIYKILTPDLFGRIFCTYSDVTTLDILNLKVSCKELNKITSENECILLNKITRLYICKPSINSIELENILKNCIKLECLAISNCHNVASINFPKLSKFEDFTLRGAPNLTMLNLSELTALKKITISECTSIGEIDLSNQPSLRAYYAHNCTNLSEPTLHPGAEDVSIITSWSS